MSDLATLHEALKPLLDVLAGVDPSTTGRDEMEAKLPFASPAVARVRALVREGVEAGWLADRENEGIRFSRVVKAADAPDLSVDLVHMDKAGPGHTHPNGEIDLCFAVRGEPRFDDHPEGWVVYPPRSWHVPTVTGGAMDILYFLPGGAIRFEPRPEDG